MRLGSVRSHEITLANRQTVVAQDVVGRGHVEEKLRQAVVRKVDLPTELLLFGRTGAQDDLGAFLAFKLRCGRVVQKRQGLRQQHIQVGKSFLIACKHRHVHPRQPRLQQRVGLNRLGCGVFAGLRQDGFQSR